MKNLHSIIIIVLSTTIMVQAQTGYRVLDLNNKERTSFRDLHVDGSSIFVASRQFCDHDTTDGVEVSCLSVIKYDDQFEMKWSIVQDSVNGVGKVKLATTSNGYLYSFGQNDSSGHAGRPLLVSRLSTEVGFPVEEKVVAFLTAQEESNHGGAIFHNDHFYLYGDAFREDAEGVTQVDVYITKVDTNFNTVWNNRYTRTRSDRIVDLQVLPDGNLMYMNEPQRADTSDLPDIQLVTIDQDGEKVDSFEYGLALMEDVMYGGPPTSTSFGIDDEGYVYLPTNSQIIETEEDVRKEFTSGTINKFTPALDSVLYSQILEKNPPVSRRTEVFDFTLARNGDLLICGQIRYGGPRGTTEYINVSHNAFMARMTADGEVKWIRIYRLPHDRPDVVSTDETGNYRETWFAEVAELDDGRIVAGGTASYREVTPFIATGEPWQELFVILADSTGCIDGEECDETIILDGDYRPKDGYRSMIDDKVWYTYNRLPTGSISPRYTHTRDSLWQGYGDGTDGSGYSYYFPRMSSANEDGSAPYLDGYYRELEGKLFRYNGLDQEIMLLDMSLQIGDHFVPEIPFGDQARDTLYVVAVDTVAFDDNIPRKVLKLSCSPGEVPHWESPVIWIEGIGDLGVPTEDEDYCAYGIGGLLITCVADSGESVFFRAAMMEDNQVGNNEQCWYDEVNTQDRDPFEAKFYPNPTRQVLVIESQVAYDQVEILDAMGRVMLVSEPTAQIDLSALRPGMYIIRLLFDGVESLNRKFVKI